jgi:tRNA-modifying protein YgfZ
MTSLTFERHAAEGGWIDLSDHARLALTGADRVRYLQGQVTADVRLATAERALAACFLNHKGKLDAYVTLSATDDTLWLDAPADLHDSLPVRVEKYIIADDVTVTDISDTTHLLHFMASAVEVPLAPGERRVSHARFGVPGFDLWCAAPRLGFWQSQGTPLPPDYVEAQRIAHRTPLWGHELTHDILPPEARLDEHAISYDKGCYLGQEVISRIKTAGKIPKRLSCFRLRDALPRGTPLTEAGSEVGHLTSSITHPILGPLALGYLTRHAGPGPWNDHGVTLLEN